MRHPDPPALDSVGVERPSWEVVAIMPRAITSSAGYLMHGPSPCTWSGLDSRPHEVGIRGGRFVAWRGERGNRDDESSFRSER